MFGSLLTLLSAGIIGLVGYVWVGNYLRAGGGGGSGSGSDSGGSATTTATGPKTPGTLSGKPSRAQVAAGAKTSAVPPPLPKRTEAQTAQMAKEQSARDAAAAKAAAEAAKAASEKAAKELKEANARDKEAAKAAAAQAAAAAKEAAAKEAAAAKLAQQREKEAKEAAAAAEKERIAAEKAAAAAEKERIAAEKAAAAAEKERLAAEAKRAAQAEADRAQAERERVQAERERHLREKEREAAEKDAADKKAAKAASLLSLAMASPPALPKRPMLNILHAPTLTESVAFSPSPRDSSASASAEPSSARSGDSDAASKAAKAEDHRRQVLWEMVASEEKYISSLNALMEVFFRPLKVKADKGSDKISPAEFSLLFSNVEAIWQFHKMMLPALKTSPDGNVAAVLQAHADYLKMYTKYVADYTPALQTVNKLYKREGFMRLIKKQRELPAAEGLDLMSYLIMPVQRVPRYLLLLKELQKWTPAGHPHSASLESAIAKVGKIATFINEETRAQENASLLLQFQHQIQQMPDDVVLFQPHRRLVRHGLLKLVKQEGTTVVNQLPLGQSYMCILCNDIILYATPDWNYRGSLKLQDAKLNVDQLMVELVKEKTASRRAQMSLRLECPSADEATRWAHSLRDSIKAANELGLQDEKRRAFNSAAFVR